MSNYNLDMQQIKQMHQAGFLAEAKKAYHAYLDQHGDELEALHLLGLVYAEEGNFTQATFYLEKARLHAGIDDLSLFLHLANVYKAKACYEEARACLDELLSYHPQFAEAYNNLGTIYFAENNFKAASECFVTAIHKKADYFEAYYNLGLALTKLQNLREAMHTFNSLLMLEPNYHAARFQLATLCMQQEQFKEATEHWRFIIEREPQVAEAHVNLATCYLKTKQLKAAREHYMAALKLTPDDCQVLFNLGVLGMNEGKIENAIYYYQQVLRIDPRHFAAHNNLGVAFLTIKNTDAALAHFEEALRLEPQHESLRYTISSLKHETKTKAPQEYIKTLFDSYADHYDAHMALGLNYQVPQEIHHLLNQVHLPKIEVAIDLGCGTGLCGPYLYVLTKHLIGVDLSAKMLAKAREKEAYHELVESDLFAYLENLHVGADLLVAADVLIYLGDLEEFFLLTHQALKTKGILIFSAEMTQQDDYVLTEAGRFTHNKAYIDRLINQYHFNLRQYKVIRKRTQDGVAVLGHLYMLQK